MAFDRCLIKDYLLTYILLASRNSQLSNSLYWKSPCNWLTGILKRTRFRKVRGLV